MSDAVQVVVLDVNQTLSDLEPLRDRLSAQGAPGHLLETWFAATLRDGFGLAAAGTSAPFRDVAREALRVLLAAQDSLRTPVDDLAEAVVEALGSLPLHPDVPAGLRSLHDAGLRLVTLTNSSSAVTKQLLHPAGVEGLFSRHLSVEDAGRWKPHPDAYRYAAEQCEVPPSAICLIAVHPWDVDGAARAGMHTGWLNRQHSPYPQVFRPADHVASHLPALSHQIVAC